MESQPSPVSRRMFLGGLAAAGSGRASPPRSEAGRADRAYQIRVDAAQLERDAPAAIQINNGDEDLYANRIGNYSKGLPHNDNGEVDLNAYSALLNALSTGRPADFEAIAMGSPDPAAQRKFVDPQAGIAFNLEGADSHHMSIAPAPAFSSAEQAADAAELYWHALA